MVMLSKPIFLRQSEFGVIFQPEIPSYTFVFNSIRVHLWPTSPNFTINFTINNKCIIKWKLYVRLIGSNFCYADLGNSPIGAQASWHGNNHKTYASYHYLE